MTTENGPELAEEYLDLIIWAGSPRAESEAMARARAILSTPGVSRAEAADLVSLAIGMRAGGAGDELADLADDLGVDAASPLLDSTRRLHHRVIRNLGLVLRAVEEEKEG